MAQSEEQVAYAAYVKKATDEHREVKAFQQWLATKDGYIDVPNMPEAPTHPDFKRLEAALVADPTDMRQLMTVLMDIIDIPSVQWIGAQRALKASLGSGIRQSVSPQMLMVWLDGFAAGARFGSTD